MILNISVFQDFKGAGVDFEQWTDFREQMLKHNNILGTTVVENKMKTFIATTDSAAVF
ncbi:hypothetical protein HanIR_Chr05g0236731 [Helianthus annuus]|nr:hypothetical protein HanIR_Chr05g0236731 [Helianthus annuus]